MQRVANLIVIAAACAAVSSTSAFAQAVQTPGGADPAPSAPGPYAGASKSGFYGVEQRIAALKSRLSGMAGTAARRARSQLASIEGFLDQQRARHGGELRDWDREMATARLNRVEDMVGQG